MKTQVVPELIFEAEGPIERIEVDPYSASLAVQVRTPEDVLLYVWPSGRRLKLPPNAYLDHVQHARAYFLMTGSNSDYGISGVGTVDLTSGLAIWHETLAGRWLPTTQESVWATSEQTYHNFTPSGTWVNLPINRLDKLRESVQMREKELAQQLSTSEWVDPSDERFIVLNAWLTHRFQLELASPLLRVEQRVLRAVAGLPTGCTSGANAILVLASDTSELSLELPVRESESMPEGLMIWRGAVWFLLAGNCLYRVADAWAY